MTARRTMLLLLAAALLSLLAACSDSRGGTSSLPTAGSNQNDPRATFAQAAQTAAAVGTSAAQAPTPRPTDTPIPISSLSGDFDARFVYQGQRPDSDVRETLEMPDHLALAIGEGTVTISGRDPFVAVSGSLSAAGDVSATGTGTNEDWGELTATFAGTLANQRLTGIYTLTGDIPGGSVAYNVTGIYKG